VTTKLDYLVPSVFDHDCFVRLVIYEQN